MRYTLCTAALKSSRWIWNSLRDARTLDMQLGEESITDFFLMNLRRWAPHPLKIKTFTKREEATSGGDWEWWFTGPSAQWLGIRVQAKVIKLSTNHFEHLHYNPKGGPSQCKRLEQDAFNNRMLPAYCLYTNWLSADNKMLARLSGRRVFRRTEYGAALVSVDHVAALQKLGHHKLEQIVPYMKPFRELFCTAKYTEQELPQLVFRNITGMYPLAGSFDDRRWTESETVHWFQYANREQFFVRADAPVYVYRLLQSDIGTLELNELDQNIDRITVFQQTASLA
ncbi:MAG: hypothetical protein DCC55_33830 [Chloroflexi bacterium]|nr:MAG: hypothetical protein DCC55_33830 [Chloroflexota bacterium]